MTRISAGTWSPSSKSTTSPGTNSHASTTVFLPSRMHLHFFGIMFLNPSMIFSDLASCKYEKVAVIVTTAYKTMPKNKLV